MESSGIHGSDWLAPCLQRMPTLAQRLQFLRDRQKLSRKDAAEAANISYTSIYKMETGEPVSIDILKRYIMSLDMAYDCVTDSLDMNQLVTDRLSGRSEMLLVNNSDHIGPLIRRHRKERRMTQQELAQKAFITQAAVSNIEVGRTTPGQRTLRYIAIALGLRTEQLLQA